MLGAVVVKIQVHHHERKWQTDDHEVIVVDRFGVIFLSSRPDWLFRTLAPLTEAAAAELKESRRYADRTRTPRRRCSRPAS